jgi:hypothetical protein
MKHIRTKDIAKTSTVNFGEKLNHAIELRVELSFVLSIRVRDILLMS